jgi:hypothetical protein
MVIESKKITGLQKMYDKIRKYCVMNFVLKSGGALVYDNVLNCVNKLIDGVKEQDKALRKKKIEDVSKYESMVAQGFSYKYIKNMMEQRKVFENKQKAKKEYMDKIIYEAYYRRKDDDRDFGGELDIWGKSTQEFNFITRLGVENPYAELQGMRQKKEVELGADEVILLLKRVIDIFETQKDKGKITSDLIDVFSSYGINLL